MLIARHRVQGLVCSMSSLLLAVTEGEIVIDSALKLRDVRYSLIRMGWRSWKQSTRFKIQFDKKGLKKLKAVLWRSSVVSWVYIVGCRGTLSSNPGPWSSRVRSLTAPIFSFLHSSYHYDLCSGAMKTWITSLYTYLHPLPADRGWLQLDMVCMLKVISDWVVSCSSLSRTLVEYVLGLTEIISGGRV